MSLSCPTFIYPVLRPALYPLSPRQAIQEDTSVSAKGGGSVTVNLWLLYGHGWDTVGVEHLGWSESRGLLQTDGLHAEKLVLGRM